MTASTSRPWKLTLLGLVVGGTALFTAGGVSAFPGRLPAEDQRGTTATPAPQTAKPAGTPETRRNDGPPRPGTPEWFAVGWDWWQDADVKKELGLTEEKARKIQAIYERRYSQMKPFAADFELEWRKLEQMTRERAADEATYALQVNRLENLSAKLRESRTVMLYTIYRELSPEQNKKLQEIRDRRSNRNGRSGGSSKSHQ